VVLFGGTVRLWSDRPEPKPLDVAGRDKPGRGLLVGFVTAPTHPAAGVGIPCLRCCSGVGRDLNFIGETRVWMLWPCQKSGGSAKGKELAF